LIRPNGLEINGVVGGLGVAFSGFQAGHPALMQTQSLRDLFLREVGCFADLSKEATYFDMQ
jgi:hypothetical protein